MAWADESLSEWATEQEEWKIKIKVNSYPPNYRLDESSCYLDYIKCRSEQPKEWQKITFQDAAKRLNSELLMPFGQADNFNFAGECRTFSFLGK